MCVKKHNEVLVFPKDIASKVRDKITQMAAANPTVENLPLHVGSNDVVRQQSEDLKQDFTELLDAISCLGA